MYTCLLRPLYVLVLVPLWRVWRYLLCPCLEAAAKFVWNALSSACGGIYFLVGWFFQGCVFVLTPVAKGARSLAKGVWSLAQACVKHVVMPLCSAIAHCMQGAYFVACLICKTFNKYILEPAGRMIRALGKCLWKALCAIVNGAYRLAVCIISAFSTRFILHTFHHVGCTNPIDAPHNANMSAECNLYG